MWSSYKFTKLNKLHIYTYECTYIHTCNTYIMYYINVKDSKEVIAFSRHIWVYTGRKTTWFTLHTEDAILLKKIIIYTVNHKSSAIFSQIN